MSQTSAVAPRPSRARAKFQNVLRDVARFGDGKCVFRDRPRAVDGVARRGVVEERFTLVIPLFWLPCVLRWCSGLWVGFWGEFGGFGSVD